MGNSHTAPQAENTMLTSTSEIDSESALAILNFDGSSGILLIFAIAIIVSFFLYQFFGCCMNGGCSSCSRQHIPNNQGSNNDNQGANSAIIALSMAVGQQQNMIMQQQHQQQLYPQLQQPTRVTPRYSDYTGYSYSSLNQQLQQLQQPTRVTSDSTVNQGIKPTAPALESTTPL